MNNEPNPTPQEPTQPIPPPQTMYVTRPAIPEAQHVSEEAKRLHDKSVQLFPSLNLSEGEYVISAVRRHLIGLVSIWSVFVLFVVIMIGVSIFYITDGNGAAFPLSFDQLISGMFILLGLITLGSAVATYIYLQNKFFLTNESVIQEVQTSLFARREQTVSLSNIEDASFRQRGIIQMLFNYGSIRLSTQGDETTYRFNWVANPRRQIDTLNNAVEDFKNGRPIRD